MARPTLLKDEKLYRQVIDDLAAGVPQVRIAESLGIPETTLSSWKKRKDFRRDLALKEIEIAREPINKVRENSPLAWLERKFREDWGPPKQKIDADVNVSKMSPEQVAERLKYLHDTGIFERYAKKSGNNSET